MTAIDRAWPARIYIKLFAAASSAALSDSRFIPVFQRWIREDALPGTWIDVADYGHVHEGPGVLLAGHERHIMTDRAGGRLGLVSQSRQSQGLRQDLDLLVKACSLLESAPELEGILVFGVNKLEIGVNERLRFGTSEADRSLWERMVLESLRASGLQGSRILATEPGASGLDSAGRCAITIAIDGKLTLADLASRILRP